MQYSSTSVRSLPLKRMPTGCLKTSASWKGLRGSIDRWSGRGGSWVVSFMPTLSTIRDARSIALAACNRGSPEGQGQQAADADVERAERRLDHGAGRLELGRVRSEATRLS